VTASEILHGLNNADRHVADHATLAGMEYIAPSLPIIITVCLTTVGIILTVVLLNNGTNGKIDDLRKETHANEIQIIKVQEGLSQVRKDVSNLLTRVVKLEEELEGFVVKLKRSMIKLEKSVVKLETSSLTADNLIAILGEKNRLTKNNQ